MGNQARATLFSDPPAAPPHHHQRGGKPIVAELRSVCLASLDQYTIIPQSINSTLIDLDGSIIAIRAESQPAPSPTKYIYRIVMENWKTRLLSNKKRFVCSRRTENGLKKSENKQTWHPSGSPLSPFLPHIIKLDS